MPFVIYFVEIAMISLTMSGVLFRVDYLTYIYLKIKRLKRFEEIIKTNRHHYTVFSC